MGREKFTSGAGAVASICKRAVLTRGASSGKIFSSLPSTATITVPHSTVPVSVITEPGTIRRTGEFS